MGHVLVVHTVWISYFFLFCFALFCVFLLLAGRRTGRQAPLTIHCYLWHINGTPYKTCKFALSGYASAVRS